LKVGVPHNPRRGWVQDGVGYIPLTRGLLAMVDANMVEQLSRWNWTATTNRGGRSYAYRMRSRREPGPRKIPMHRVVAGTPAGMVTDHINGDSLDNRRANLRNCSAKENANGFRATASHGGRVKGGTSRHAGVWWDADRMKWRAAIRRDGRRRVLGDYDTEDQAAEAYRAAAQKHDPIRIPYHGDRQLAPRI
jgi:hypothetical protein